ncbi:MAG: hypothetical protein RR320_05290 [Oscillospiraceae bacterium]
MLTVAATSIPCGSFESDGYILSDGTFLFEGNLLGAHYRGFCVTSEGYRPNGKRYAPINRQGRLLGFEEV